MSDPTHAYTSNGRSHTELVDWFLPFPEQLHRLLSLLDGADNSTLSLWAMPPGERLSDFNPETYESGYLQSAGSASGMSVEVRYLEDDGNWRQYAVGKPGGSYVGGPAEHIAYGTYTVDVYDNEVFTADEAAPVYEAYRATGRVPQEYLLRRLDV